MKNDLTVFEKNLLRHINFINGKNYNYTNLMEWSNMQIVVEEGKKDDEIIYEALGIFVAINP